MSECKLTLWQFNVKKIPLLIIRTSNIVVYRHRPDAL